MLLCQKRDKVPKGALSNAYNKLYYIIIDEVQLMDEFVDVLNSFCHIDDADTYVTGGNSHFLSSDIGLRNAILDMRQQEETHIHREGPYHASSQ